MLLKKTNAIAALCIILFLTGHMETMCFSLLTGWYNLSICKTFAYLAAGAFCTHAFLSIVILFFLHDGTSLRYPKENKRLILQRGTALVMLVFIHTHTQAYAHMATGEVLSQTMALFFCVCEIIYIVSVLTHTALSLSKGLVTLGAVHSISVVTWIDRIAAIICSLAGIVAIFAVTGFFLF